MHSSTILLYSSASSISFPSSDFLQATPLVSIMVLTMSSEFTAPLLSNRCILSYCSFKDLISCHTSCIKFFVFRISSTNSAIFSLTNLWNSATSCKFIQPPAFLFLMVSSTLSSTSSSSNSSTTVCSFFFLPQGFFSFTSVVFLHPAGEASLVCTIGYSGLSSASSSSFSSFSFVLLL